MVSTYIPEDNYYVEENINFIIEKPGQHHVNQLIEVTITNDKTSWHPVPSGVMHWGYITSMEFLPKMHNYEKQQPNQNWGLPYETSDQYSTKSTKVMKGRNWFKGDWGDTTTKYKMRPWIESWARKRMLVRRR